MNSTLINFSLECVLYFFSAKSAKLASLFGTVEFLAPEMIECTYATFASDAWSVGVLSYMLVTGGKSPFYAGNRFKTVSIKPIDSLCFISNAVNERLVSHFQILS